MASPDPLSSQSVGEALTLLRARAGKTRDDIAHDADVATGTLSRYERDVTISPDPDALQRLIVVLAELTDTDPDLLWIEIGELIDRQQKSRRYTRARVRAIQRGRGKATRAP